MNILLEMLVVSMWVGFLLTSLAAIIFFYHPIWLVVLWMIVSISTVFALQSRT